MPLPTTPPTRSVDRTWKGIVLERDPDFEITKRNEPEYEFRGRTFSADRSKRWPYE